MPDGTFLQAYVTSWGMMANGYYDFALAWGKPYLGVGLGWASNRINDVFISKFNGIKHGGTSSGFAWSVKGGVGVPLSPALTLDVAVGYTDLGKLQIDPGAVTSGATTLAIYGGANGKLKAWEASVGLRF
jgi:opacity protein-like surface antigen